MNRILSLFLLLTATRVWAFPPDEFFARARETHGVAGRRAAQFLHEHMPAHDRESLDEAFLFEHLDLAMAARTRFPWARDVPEDMYLNDVLPYASLDESRESWRPEFTRMATPIVAGAATATEAALRLNRDFFDEIHVHYSTGRKRPNQSPGQSMKIGKATCTGLSIILVNACRAVGIPARVVGTPLWTNRRGNHTWVEIWDGGWHYMGADEYDAAGLDRGWFSADAARAQADVPRHAIYATSWRRTGTHFPMVWSRADSSVAAVNVTTRYARQADTSPELGIRYLSPGGTPVASTGSLTTPAGTPIGTFTTRGEGADRNDLPRLAVTPGTTYRVRFGDLETAPFVAGEGVTTMDIGPGDLRPVPDLTGELAWDQVARATQRIYQERIAATRADRLGEMESRQILQGEHTLRWMEKTFGDPPADGSSLWISMHGGGGAPARVNDQQWKNQAALYEPSEGIYVAPRAPTDAWNLWHQGHIDPLFHRLIENFVALRGVDPNKVYLMGYSAGGDGVWQLAPRMADRFAAAAMMAGHPNEASLLGLRNLPFALFVGGDDGAYNRNQIVAERAAQLADLQAQDPDGYAHFARVYDGLGHWMQKRDAEALPWMAGFTRDPWPRKLVWFQDDVTHDRFYWLRLPTDAATPGQKIVATVEGQTICLTGDVPRGTRIRLCDRLLDLSKPITVSVNGRPAFTTRVQRDARVLKATLSERLDPAAAAYAELVIE